MSILIRDPACLQSFRASYLVISQHLKDAPPRLLEDGMDLPESIFRSSTFQDSLTPSIFRSRPHNPEQMESQAGAIEIS